MNNKKNWEHIDLEAFRQIGDPDVDNLVADLLPKQGGESIGCLGYNSMLLIADKLVSDPELALIGNSRLSQWLHTMPEELVDYFRPMEAPDWVDTRKLQLGSQLWRQNTLLTLFILYAGSLPACYLLKNGITALYKTKKLSDHQYIFQRIYETGLMLAACMDEKGIELIGDAALQDDNLLLQALKNLDAEGQWQEQGQQLVRKSGKTGSPIDPEELDKEIERLAEKPKRYLWGKGYITAKKVRFLHASMRYMLTQPDRFKPWGSKDRPQTFAEYLSQVQEPWDNKELGVPVNQEDMAYTLLTFGLVIPRGMEKWGAPLSREQKEAFLHLWRVVGYTMGIHSELLTDNWDDAESLYQEIQKRQAEASDDGLKLTEALMGFLGDYLPDVPGFAHRLSAAMIISQIGLTHASYILDKQLIDETLCFWRKPVYKLAGGIFNIGLKLRARFYERFKHLGGITLHSLDEASELLIDSWQDAFSRRPFFVPVDTTSWVRQPGTDEPYRKLLSQWRRQIFITLASALGLLSLALVSLAAALPIALISGWTASQLALIAAASFWIIAIGILHFRLQAVFKKRPEVEQVKRAL